MYVDDKRWINIKTAVENAKDVGEAKGLVRGFDLANENNKRKSTKGSDNKPTDKNRK